MLKWIRRRRTRRYARKASSGAMLYARLAAEAEWEFVRYCKERGWALTPRWKLMRNVQLDEQATELAQRVVEYQEMHKWTEHLAKGLSRFSMK